MKGSLYVHTHRVKFSWIEHCVAQSGQPRFPRRVPARRGLNCRCKPHGMRACHEARSCGEARLVSRPFGFSAPACR